MGGAGRRQQRPRRPDHLASESRLLARSELARMQHVDALFPRQLWLNRTSPDLVEDLREFLRARSRFLFTRRRRYRPRGVIGKVNIPIHKHAKFRHPELCRGRQTCIKTCENGAISTLQG